MNTATTSDLKLYFRLLGYVRPYWRIFALSLCAMIVLAGTSPATAALFKYITAGVFLNADKQEIPLIITALIAIYAVAGIAAYVGGLSLHWVANKVVMDLRADMFSRLLDFPSSYYDQHTPASLISRFSFDVTQIKEASTNVLTVFVKDALTIIGLLAWMIYIDWEMTAVALMTTPIIMFLLLVIRRRLRRMSRKVQQSMSQIHHVLDEVINGQRIVKLFGGKQQEIQRFQNTISDNRHFTMKFVSASQASSPTVQIITAITLAIIVYISAQKSSAGTLGVDEFISFFAAVAMILGPLKRLVRINEHVQRGLAACESVFGLLDEETETDTGTDILSRIDGSIEISGLSFQYDVNESKTLKDISLHIKRGETVALVGASGSGKTTLANLIPRFYQKFDGKIILDGKDISEFTLASLRANIALVSQEIILFNDTLRNNIAYGLQQKADDNQIISAAEAAHAMEFIRELPDGLDTVIGDKGSRLSGGQRQRIALARALLKAAPILILDEATSALDAESERQIQQAMADIRQTCTCIIIAHRLSTIENADRIIVLEKGRIVESGYHTCLLKNNGVYSKLYSSGIETGTI